jgi:tRNA nucleotidyltransferase/poly(A) polymerase
MIENLKALFKDLSRLFDFTLVGGIPRDYILHLSKNGIKPIQKSKSIFQVDFSFFYHFLQNKFQKDDFLDIDISTTQNPKEIAKILDNYLQKNLPQSKRTRQFATNSFNIQNIKIEITSTRIDKNCDGKNATMKHGVSYFRDSSRRDFTFNAIYMNFNGTIFDFHNGINHLFANEIHFIGDAKTRILEDFTRIKRYQNFCQRFNMENKKIEEAINYIINNKTTPIIMR